MRMILKIAAVPVMVLCKLIFWIGITLVKLSAYLSGPALTVLAVFSVLCVIDRNWSNLIIFVALAVMILILTFGAAWILVHFDDAGDALSDFIHS